jgi:hypothetical protein
MALCAFVGVLCLAMPRFGAMADEAGTNGQNGNSGFNQGQGCGKLNKATQEYKECIHRQQGKTTQSHEKNSGTGNSNSTDEGSQNKQNQTGAGTVINPGSILQKILP